jgi:DNA-directed RNA polymerase subunit alpha
MHIIHNTIGVPKITQKDLEQNVSVFTVGPLPKWYWVTIGNSLRRILLSSIPWTRVTGIKVKWVSHEYSTLPWVKDSIVDIMLNLKWLVLGKKDIWTEWLKLSKNKAWVVTADDIKAVAWIEVLNKDLYITEIDRDGLELEIDIRVEKWVWYLTQEELQEREEDVEILLMDTSFSPVLNVKYSIEKSRFWDMIDLDSLVMTVTTDGSITPVDALKFSWDMLTSYFSVFNEESLQIEWQFISDVKDLLSREKEEVQVELEKESYTPIEIMWLSPRTLNALINWDILSIEKLSRCTETKLSSIKWFGKKAMTEIKDALSERWMKLLWDD